MLAISSQTSGVASGVLHAACRGVLTIHRRGRKQRLDLLVSTKENLSCVPSCPTACVHAGMLQWGNVFLSIARKLLDEAAIKGSFSEHQARIESEFDKATAKYKEALSIKADFYDGEMQLGQVDFERAKLTAGFIPQPVR